jgi:hypothetical protein
MYIARRFTTSLIEAEAARLYQKDAGRIGLLVDTEVQAPDGVEVIDVRTAAPSALDPSFAFVIHAVDQDDLALPFVARLIELGVKFYPVFFADPARWPHKDRVAREIIEAEIEHQVRENFPKFDCGTGDAENLCQALHLTRDVPGDFVEIGCYRGSSGRIALHYMKTAGIRRRSYFFDVFDGFTYPEARASADAIWVDSHETDGIATVAARLRALDAAAIVMRNNVISDELPPEIGAIAVANLDVDQYEAVYAGLLKLSPRIAPGGILIARIPDIRRC